VREAVLSRESKHLAENPGRFVVVAYPLDGGDDVCLIHALSRGFSAPKVVPDRLLGAYNNNALIGGLASAPK
jgi:hypothetical protein